MGNFAQTTGILGINVIADEIQRDPAKVKLIKDRGQVLFCWTDDQNNPAIVQHLKSLGVDGIIYDRIDVNSVKEVKQSIFMMDKEEEEDEEQQKTPSQCSCNSPPRDPNKSPATSGDGGGGDSSPPQTGNSSEE